MIFYTDAITESRDLADELLGESGFLELVQNIEASNAQRMGQAILERLRLWTGNRPCDDDLTLLVVRHSHGARRTPGVLERLNGYSKVLGLKPV